MIMKKFQQRPQIPPAATDPDALSLMYLSNLDTCVGRYASVKEERLRRREGMSGSFCMASNRSW
jgi:hypothetical protein